MCPSRPTEDAAPEELLDRAKTLVHGGVFGGLSPGPPSRLFEPIPVQDPDGSLNSWFVPVVVGEKLLGFLQFTKDLTLLRSSTFQREVGSMDDCPDAADWIDMATIQSRVREEASPGEVLGDPVLSYDKHPSRLAWAVTATSPSGEIRTFMVAGRYVFGPSG